MEDNKNNEKQEVTESTEKSEDKKNDMLKKVGEGIKHVFGMRQTKYGTNTAVAILALLGVLVIANFIAKKENVRWDLTKSKKYSLSDQTKKVLDRVDQDVQITLFYQASNPEKANAENLLNEYKELSGHIQTEFIDPDKNPAEAKKYEVDRYGTVIFEMGEKKELATMASETEFTSSILKLTRDEIKKIYFLGGHAEKDIEGMDQSSYSTVKSSLEKEGYEVAKLSLLTKPEIPEDLSVLVIAGPQKKLLPKEKEVIEKYVDDGGKMLLLVDPKSEVKADTGFSSFVSKWGVHSDRHVVIDPKLYFWTDPSAPVINAWATHQITEKLSAAFFPGVGEMSAASDAPAEYVVTSLAGTSPDSWLEMSIEKKEVEFNEDKDKKGPISVAVAVEGTSTSEEESEEANSKNTRLIVVGDSDFAVDGFADSLGNQDFFLNSINYLASEEDLISIRPKDEEERTVALTGGQSKTIFYGTVFGMPVVVIIAGILVWLRRRKK
ncbi:MAG: GldG family protein [Parcubacteria group bacterium]|nr:GldG family protein [Parcubacteria group bacterium]